MKSMKLLIIVFLFSFAMIGCSKTPEKIASDIGTYTDQKKETSSYEISSRKAERIENPPDDASSSETAVPSEAVSFEPTNSKLYPIMIDATENLKIVSSSEDLMEKAKFGITNQQGELLVSMEYDNIIYYPEQGYFHMIFPIQVERQLGRHPKVMSNLCHMHMFLAKEVEI